MYESANYPTSLEEAESFASGQPHGTLIVAAPGGWPQVSVLPFVKEPDRILLHAVREDPTCKALRETDRATFLVSEFLAFTPHDWVEDRNASRATLHFRAISYECRATVDDDPGAVAAVLRRILERYEPGADYEPLLDGDYYGPRLRRLCAITLDVVERKAKFKAGSYGPDAMKLDVARRLRERGRREPGSLLDLHAARVIEAAVRTSSEAGDQVAVGEGSPRGGRRRDGFVERMREALGGRAVLTGRGACAQYDEEPTGRWRGRARCVLLPADTEEVAAALVLCAEAGVAVVPQGGRTGLVGGGVALDGEVVLSTGRLRRLEPVDRLSGQVTVDAGVTLAELQAHAGRDGLALPVDLAARDACTVGGMVATNAGGVRVLRWGTMRDRVAGVEAALPTGEVVSHLGGLPKDNTGYHLAQLLAGSEGTLGVVTRVRLRLAPLAAHRYTALLGHRDAAGALETLVRLRERLPTLEAAEIMWNDGVELVASAFELRDPLPGAPAALLVESAAPDDHLDRFAGAIADCPAVEASAVATDSGARERLWRIRELHAEAVHRLGPPAKFDVTVPAAALAAFVDAVRPAVREVAPEATLVLFGHAGDGNLHVNVVTEQPDDPRLEDAVLGLVVGAGGSISAEHGIGRAKRRWLERSRSPGDLAAMRRIRNALDPSGIMNPGVLWPAPGV